MAMIQCPHCGKQISDKAEICPHCKERLIEEETIKCSECGEEVSASHRICPNCGAPLVINDDIQKVEVTRIATSSVNKKAKKTILLALIGLVVVVGLVFAIASNNKKKFEAKWQENYDVLMIDIIKGAAEAETTAGLIHDIWFNTIYEKADPNTNKYCLGKAFRNNPDYTRKTSVPSMCFNDDFNESLSVYFSSNEYKTSAAMIDSNQKEVASMMSTLQEKIPEGKENAYNAISALYDQYLGFTNLALNPTGNLNSYTSSYNQYENDLLAAYNKSETFMSGN